MSVAQRTSSPSLREGEENAAELPLKSKNSRKLIAGLGETK